MGKACLIYSVAATKVLLKFVVQVFDKCKPNRPNGQQRESGGFGGYLPFIQFLWLGSKFAPPTARLSLDISAEYKSIEVLEMLAGAEFARSRILNIAVTLSYRKRLNF
jgi:hypothetical protein